LPSANSAIRHGQVRKATAEFIAHYHTERNHQGLDNALICPDPGHAVIEGKVHRRERLGGLPELLLPQGCLRITTNLDQDAACILCTVALELAIIPGGNARGLSGGLSVDMADRGYMLSLSLFDYTDDVMAARDRPIDFSDITG
jgi:hypothetical protein